MWNMSCYFLIWPESTAVADNELRMIIFFSTNKSNIKNDYVAEDVFFFFFATMLISQLEKTSQTTTEKVYDHNRGSLRPILERS